MNDIETLITMIESRFPDASLSLDPPERSEGRWYLDIKHGDYPIVVEWVPARGFGISTPTGESIGEGPDETYVDVQATWERVRGLLLSQTKTRLPATQLAELRSMLGMSQAELAERLQVQQAAISRLERRADMRVSTLSQFVNAIGGILELRVLFPEGTHSVLTFDQPPPRRASKRARGAISWID